MASATTHSASRAPVWPQALGLAAKDLWHDRYASMILILTVAAILAPLLLLLGLKTGVVWTLRESLLRDPRTLEVIVYGNTRLDHAWLEGFARHPGVAFLIPKTRTINATLDLIGPDRRIAEAVEVIPTARGDPLIPPDRPVPAQPDQVLVTETLAERLGLTSGGLLTAIVKRDTDGRPEHAALTLRVVGIVPQSRVARDAVFTGLDLLVAAEDYRDGLRRALTDGDLKPGIAADRKDFANARIYAVSLDAVAPVADVLRARGVEVRTRAEQIETVRALDQTLSFVFQVIALIGSLGCALALGGAIRGNVERKRRDLALLRLLGFANGSVILIPLAQSVAIAATGFVLACLAYLAGAAAFNHSLGTHLAGRGYVCRLDAAAALVAWTATLGIALLAASAGGHRASRIDPAEALRESYD
jgi:putative ABC transport system permease protein